MIIEDKTTQELAIESAKKELSELEAVCKYFAEKDMKKFKRSIRSVINEKTAELQRLVNHYQPPQIVDAREEYVKAVESEMTALKAENERLKEVIKVNEEIARRQDDDGK